jgi:hypothetical protein
MSRILTGVVILTTLGAVSLLMLGASVSDGGAEPVKWEYGTYVMQRTGSGEILYWRDRDEKIEADSLQNLSKQLGIGFWDVSGVALLNHAGEQGWELVAITETATERADVTLWIFKRPMQ